MRSGTVHSARELPGWGPALATAIWPSLLRSSITHDTLKLAIEIWHCPLKYTIGENDDQDGDKKEDDAEREEEEELEEEKINNFYKIQ